jgi:hypothetical protein
LFVVALIVVGLAVRLDDDSASAVRRSGLTTTPTSSPLPVESLVGSDLGGTIHRRSGNQP